MTIRLHAKRTDLTQRATISGRVSAKAAPYVDNDLVQVERAGLFVAAGLAGAAITALAGFLIGGSDSILSIVLPCAFLGWMLSVVLALQE
jgi:hypothetical protein